MKTTKQKPIPIGRKLVRALTKDQVAHLLTVIFDLFDDHKIKELSAKVDKDIAATLSRLVTAKTPDTKPPLPERIVSDEKYIEEWNKLWGAWGDIAFEVGDEEGKYVHQEHHWEHPYFAGDTLAEDLDQVAEKMLPRLEKIYSLGTEEDNIFIEGLQEIGTSIYSLPEWLGAAHEDFCLGPMTTECVLKWEWFVARSQAQPPIAFLERIIEIERTSKLLELHDRAVVEFFMTLSEAARKQIYEYITANRNDPQWKERLRSSHSKWHQIYHNFSAAFSPETYLENCRALLYENWRYGLPLVENLVEKKQYSEAEKMIALTFSSYFSQFRAKQNWKPEDSLLMEFLKYFFAAPDNEIVKLFKHWRVISEKLGQVERMAALKLQLIVYETPYQWDDIAKVFREISRSEFSDLAGRLFEQWQAYIFALSARSFSGAEINKEATDTWIHWLLETGVDDAKDSKWFAQKVNSWLELLHENPAQFKKQYPLVYILTLDLAKIFNFKERYPKLFSFVRDDVYTHRESTPIRRAWLKKMQGDQFIPLLMKCWQQSVWTLVPDPTRSLKSTYEEHAEWLAVVHELNPKAYKAIIDKWKIDHKRRRNLWLAIKAQNLPVE